MTRPTFCVDANICIKLVIEEHDTALAVALWRQWTSQRAIVLAPTLWGYEMVSIVRKQVYRGLLAPDLEHQTLDEILKIPVRQVRPAQLHLRAWSLARRFNRPVAYDAHYLVVAEMADCLFWTTDERLYNSVRHELPWVRWLGQLENSN